MTLAENIETILRNRADGKLGKYLGSTADTFVPMTAELRIEWDKFGCVQ